MIYLYIQSPLKGEAEAKTMHTKVKGWLNCPSYEIGMSWVSPFDRNIRSIPVATYKIKMGTMTWREIFREFKASGGEIVAYSEVDE